MAREVKQWITVEGKHIPIFEGQTKDDAVKKYIANNSDNSKKFKSTGSGPEVEVKAGTKAKVYTKADSQDIKSLLTGKKSESDADKRMKWLQIHGNKEQQEEAFWYFQNKRAKAVQDQKDAEKAKRKEQEEKRNKEKATYQEYLGKEYKTVSNPDGSAKVYIKDLKTGKVTERYFDYARDAKRWAWQRRDFEKDYAKKQRDENKK